MRRLMIGMISGLLASASMVAAGAGTSPRSFTIAATGDIIIHQNIWRAADAHAPGTGTYDFLPLFAPIEPWIAEADLAICHLEVPLSPDNQGISSFPRFNAPHELADAIALAGYDTCSTASNHSLDQGITGLRDTLDILDAAGVRHTGTARAADEDRPALYVVQGVTVGHISATWSTNGITTPERYAVNFLERDQILADANWAREHGAEFVIVSLHWGIEYQESPSWAQRDLAEDLLESPDIDLILGHHAHVVQPIDRVEGKIVVYGMSNHLSNIQGGTGSHREGAEDGVIVHLEVTEQPNGSFSVTGVSITPTMVSRATKEILPVEHTLAGEAGVLETALQISLRRTVGRIGMLGFEEAPTTPTPWPPLTCDGLPATIWGTARDDVLSGTRGSDVIVARGGDDRVTAGAGDDLVCLGDGDDIAIGGPGNDTIFGGDGRDAIWGNTGADHLTGDAGKDSLFGGDGADRLLGGPNPDRIVGGNGPDEADGGAGDDTLFGNGGDDTLRGGNHHDRINGGPGIDILIGGGGQDRLVAGAENDTLYGDDGGDRMWGQDGNDFAYGGEGNDRIQGGDGDDTLDGGDGIDSISGGDGSDSCRAAARIALCES